MVNQNKKWIDSHAHLADLSLEELDRVCLATLSVLNVGTDIESSKRALVQASCWGGSMYVAAGVSIPEIGHLNEDTWHTELEVLIQNPLVVALGETGVDRSNSSYPPFSQQVDYFKHHLSLAMAHDKPVIVHSRGAEEQALEICLAAGAKKVLFHCYTGNVSLIEPLMQAGYSVSLSGIVTFKKGALDEVAQAIWADRLLVETDSPYLAPEPKRGSVNIPAYVSYVGERVATLRGVEEDQLAQQMRKNFNTLFQVSV